MVPVDHPLYPTFLNEYVSFDEGEHDDMLDADDIVRRLILNPNEYVEYLHGRKMDFLIILIRFEELFFLHFFIFFFSLKFSPGFLASVVIFLS